jgi:hypothetical protein
VISIAIHRTALDRAYGDGAWSRTEPVLAAYTAGLTDAGTPWSVVFLDQPEATGLAKQPADVGDVTQCVAIVRAEIAREHADAVLLIGGPEIVPLPRVPNQPTLIADGDTEIPTDNHYGCATNDPTTSPSVAVGRIGGAVEDGLEPLLQMLEHARVYRASAQPPEGALVVSNKVWQPATAAVAQHIPAAPLAFLQSPHDRVDSSDVLQRSILFFNLHGAANDPAWFGSDSLNNVFTCLEPQAVADGDLSGTLVFACNCYGAAIDGGSSARSISLAMTRAGARGFIGATGYSFGATGNLGAVEFSEELARLFFDRLAAGHPAGVALCRARQAYASQRVKPGSTRAYKTAMQFIFLGDPLL